MSEKFKSFLLNDQLFYGIVVILVALASFGLGRASVTETSISPVQNESVSAVGRSVAAPTVVATPPPASVTSPKPVTEAGLVASRSGTKYHLLTCPGAKQIKEENKIYFASVAEAEAAGYKPAANCPQLQ